jgi:hypothetical protein
MSTSAPALHLASSASTTYAECLVNTGDMVSVKFRVENRGEAVLRWTSQRWPSALKIPSPSRSLSVAAINGPLM